MLTDKRNSMWLSVQFIISVLAALIILKINILNYGSQDFGAWIVLVSIWSFSFTLDFGIGTTVVRHLAKYRGEDDKKINSFVSTGFGVFLFAAICLILAGFIVSKVLYFNNPKVISADKMNLFYNSFIIYGAAFFVLYLTGFYRAIFEGFSNFVLSSRLTIFQNILLLAGVIIIWLLHLSILFLSVVYLIVYTVILIIYILTLRITYPEVEIRITHFKKNMLREILFFSASVQATSIFSNLIDVVVKNIIANYYQTGYATIYETARRFAFAISGLFFNAFRYIMPKVSALSNKDEVEEFLGNNIVRYSKYGLLYSGLSYGIMTLPLAFFILLVFGDKSIILTFMILALPEAINNYGYPIYNFILGQGKIHFLALLQFINLIITSITVLIGFSIFKSPLGLLGYLCSVLIGNILMVWYLKKQYKINIYHFIKNLSIEKFIAFEVLLLLTVLAGYFTGANLFILIGVLCSISVVLFGKSIVENIIFFYKEIYLKKRMQNT